MKNLYELISTLKNTTSTTKKVEVIKNFFVVADEFEHKIFELYCDPQSVFYMDKKSIQNASKVCVSNLETFDTKSLYYFLMTLNTRQLTGNDALQEYATVSKSITEEEKLVLDAVILNSPIGVNHKLVNRAYRQLHNKDFVNVFECQLANTYDPSKKYDTSEWFISRKLDGLRCVFRCGKLYTRQNKPIIGFEHLEKELISICYSFGLTLVDGELYSNEIDFHDIQGIVTRSKNVVHDDKLKIKFNVFAVQSPTIDNTTDMITVMNLIKELENPEYIDIVEQYLISGDAKTIKKMTEDFVSEGYEGAMLRHPAIHYDNKRSNALIKVKFFQECDFVITGIFDGEGKNEGKLGGFHIESIDGKIKSKVGSGFSDAQREEFNTINLVGTKAQIKFFEITPDNSLRFPVFQKLKLDR